MKKRGVAQNSALVLAAEIASKAGVLVVVLVAARALTETEFALLATGLACAALLSALLDLGAGTLLARDGARVEGARGWLFRALAEARAPAAVALLVAAPLVGLALGAAPTGLAVAVLAVAGAAVLSLLGLYRSAQDIRPEALQRLACAVLSAASVSLCCLLLPRADAVLTALALSTLATLLVMGMHARRAADYSRRISPFTALRRAAPIGLLALATVAYYRSGTLALAALADPHETAVFTVAASVAFGLLMLPNAITTALLPHLSAEAEHDPFIAAARRALAWTVALAVVVSIGAAAAGPVALPLVLGAQYADAAGPFALLCIGIPLIAASGVIGTAFLSIGRIRLLAVQVACTLAINLAALAVLVPGLGAAGASLATVLCELAGLALLVHASRRELPGLIELRRVAVRAGVAPRGATTQ
jgi:O-antigen/teichoic acid export membrane protein